MPETLAVQLAPPEHDQLNHELRIRTDTETWLAETLNGNMRTSFEFYSDGEDLYGADEGSLTEIFDDSITEARLIAQENPSMLFELRRRLIEREELEEMKAMANGELGDTNTIIVISDFPPELRDSHQDIGGYNTSRKQTMLRIITKENDVIRVTTQSLDGSDREALEAIYRTLGEQPETGELLPQRVHRSLECEWQPRLIDNLTKAHDTSLSEQFGGEWHAGRRPADTRNTYDFVRVQKQQELIDWFTAEKLADYDGAEKLRFKLAATAEARFNRYLNGLDKATAETGDISYEKFVTVGGIVQGQSLQMEIGRAERQAVKLGRTYSGCGSSVSAAQGEDLSTPDSLNISGYGNKGGRDRFGSLKFKCQNGHENTRPRNQLIDKCGKCGISVKC